MNKQFLRITGYSSLVIFFIMLVSFGLVMARIRPEIVVAPDANAFTSIMKKILAIDNTIPEKTVSVTFTQEELTYLLQQAIERKSVSLTEGQLAILPDHIELYGKVRYGITPLYFISWLKPEVLDGKLHTVVSQTQIGRITLPSFVLTRINDQIVSQYNEQFSRINDSIVITSIKLSNGAAKVFGKLVVAHAS